MKKLLLLSFVVFTASPALAQTFNDALSMAYRNNPALKAAQAELRAIDSGVTEAQSGWRPTAGISGQAGWAKRKIGGAEYDLTPRSVTASITQPVFRGFRTIADTNIARANVMAGRADLLTTEQDVLLATATAYLDALRDTAVLDLNLKNETVLGEQLNASSKRFEVGTITKTDVSQSESRLARAQADRIQAEGNLNITRANFVRLVGQPPANLTEPELVLNLPKTLEEAIALAEKRNPIVEASVYAEKAADNNIDSVRGNLLPEVSVVADATRAYDEQVGVNRADQQRLLGVVTIPLYTAGADYARLKAAKETSTQRKLLVDDAQRIARNQAVSSWEFLQAANAAITAREAQRQAAELALTGVRQEAEVGTRTTLDVLDAEQEFLDARVSQVTAERDVKVASLQLLAATGQMTAENLGLPGPFYNPSDNYRDVDGAWFGE